MPTFNVNTVDWDELYDGKASYAPGKRWARAAEPGPLTSRPLRYLPDSQPPASGL